VQGRIRFNEVHVQRKTQVVQIRFEDRMLLPDDLDCLLDDCPVGEVQSQAVGSGLFSDQGKQSDRNMHGFFLGGILATAPYEVKRVDRVRLHLRRADRASIPGAKLFAEFQGLPLVV
jgi:hypothetical protein